MRALVITPQPFFSPRGTPFSVYYRTMVTASLGAEIDLLTYGEGEDPDIPGVRIIRIPRFAALGPVRIGPSPLKAFLDVFMVLYTIGLLLRHRYTFVHAHEEAVFWCRFLKPLFRFKLVYDMHSSLPQQLTNFEFTRSRLLIGMFERLERSALKSSDAVITICPDLRDYALASGVDPERHFLIENSIFDDVRLAGDDAAKSAAAAPVVPKGPGPRVLYAGTFEAYQGIDRLIRAFAIVRRERADAQLLLVGGTPEQVEAMERLTRSCGLNGQCVFTGRIPKAAALDYISTADVLVSPRVHGTNTPLKIYEQLASGKPLVATNIWSHTQVLDDRISILVDCSPEDMARGILEAVNDPGRAASVARAAQERYRTHYARDIYERKMRALVELVG